MNLKKLNYIILAFVLFIPFIIKADSCDASSITINSIELEKVTGNAEELNTASIDGKKINLNLKLYDPGDSIEYSLNVTNSFSEDSYLDEDSLKINTDYLAYEFSYDDNSNIIRAGESKIVKLKVEYENKVPVERLVEGTFNDINTVTLNVSNEGEIINPKTGNNTYIILPILLLVILIAISLLFYQKKYGKVLVLIIGTSIAIPMYIQAMCEYRIEVEAKIQVDGKEAVFINGNDFNIKVKQLVGDDTSENGRKTIDTIITGFVYSEQEPSASNKEDKNLVSTNDSPYPIYVWNDNGIIYWWSEDKTPALNEDAGHMFRGMISLKNLVGLTDFDTSNATSLYAFFAGTKANPMHIENIEPLKKWNVSNVTNLSALFQRNPDIESLEPLTNWDVHKVENLYTTFSGAKKVTTLEPLINWDVSNVINMTATFAETNSLKNLNGLENWDVSKATSFYTLFSAGTGEVTTELEDISALRNWNTSNVTDMTATIQNQKKLTNINVLANWDVSKVETFFNFCKDCTMLNNVDAIKNWDTSSVKNIKDFLAGCTSLKEIDLSNFDLSKIESTENGNLIPGCMKLERIKTPKAYPTDTNIKISLPVAFYDENNIIYTSLDNTSPTQVWLSTNGR